MKPVVKPRPLERGDLERMCLPESLWRVRADGLPGPAVAALRSYAAKVDALAPKGVGIVFLGPQGVGKTSLASILLRELRPRGYSGLFLTAWDFREFTRGKVPFDGEQLYGERARTVDLLVLDNLTELDGQDVAWGKRPIEELLSSRASLGRPTIVTTRIGSSELASGAWRGLLPLGRLVPVPVVGPDLSAVTLKLAGEALLGPPPKSTMPPTSQSVKR